jgi:plastocyanin
MRASFAVVGVATLMLLAGCTGDDSGPDETTSTTGTGGPESGPPSVSILNFTESTSANESVNVTWRVTSGDQTRINVTSTAVSWADHPVADPRTREDYGNTSGETLSTEPGEFNASFEPPKDVETLYLRAHATLEGQTYWSDEVTIRITGGLGPVGPAEIVTIEGAIALASYDPDPLTIKVGQAVQWHNSDSVGTKHTATSDGGAPSSFDTGDIAAGSDSDPIVFDVAGTYEYHCNYHPSTMMATIVVE